MYPCKRRRLSHTLEESGGATHAANDGRNRVESITNAASAQPYLLHNVNTSTGVQKNHAQLGGSYNTQNNSHTNNYFSGRRETAETRSKPRTNRL